MGVTCHTKWRPHILSFVSRPASTLWSTAAEATGSFVCGVEDDAAPDGCDSRPVFGLGHCCILLANCNMVEIKIQSKSWNHCKAKKHEPFRRIRFFGTAIFVPVALEDG